MQLLSRLLHGAPGHPAHPPLTDATIGMFVLATGLGILGASGVAPDKTGPAMWLALAGGLLVAAPTALTGFADWIEIEWGTARWRTATVHLSAMVTAVALFGVAAWLQWPGWKHGSVAGSGLAATIAGFVALTGGGWFGGAVVFVHGMRVERPGADE
jgi:uncharacterized membrane protein